MATEKLTNGSAHGPKSSSSGHAFGHDLPKLQNTDYACSRMDIFRTALAERLAKAIDIPIETAYEAIEYPKNNSAGHLAVPVPRFRKKEPKPPELAKELADKINAAPDEYIASASSVGPFLNVQLNQTTFIREIVSHIRQASSPTSNLRYGHNTSGQGKKLVIEFSSPNIAKPFHAGHLRSTIIGAFLSFLYEACGWKVVRMNYLGDWGKQYGLLAVGYARFGDKFALEKDPIKHLYHVYVSINKAAEAEGENLQGGIHDQAREYFKRMEDGDQDALNLWRTFRDLSIEKYKETYARLNIKFDHYSGESQVSKERMTSVLKSLDEHKLAQESNGAKIVDLDKYKMSKCVVQKKDGTTLYLTRDIGEAQRRYEEHKFDKMIYVIASQQDLHVAQFFKILDLLGEPFADRLQHINFGMVLGMSTRKGTVVFLDEILAEARTTMHEVMQKNEEKHAQIEDPWGVADIIGLSAVKIQDMQSKRGLNYKFEWSRMLTFEGDTGPYLQYAHSRLCSMERKAAEMKPPVTIPADGSIDGFNLALLSSSSHANELVFILAQYPDVVRLTLRTQEPSTIVTYCFKLSHSLSSAWDALWVQGQEHELAKARMLLYRCVRDVLGSALRLLGVTPLERM